MPNLEIIEIKNICAAYYLITKTISLFHMLKTLSCLVAFTTIGYANAGDLILYYIQNGSAPVMKMETITNGKATIVS